LSEPTSDESRAHSTPKTQPPIWGTHSQYKHWAGRRAHKEGAQLHAPPGSALMVLGRASTVAAVPMYKGCAVAPCWHGARRLAMTRHSTQHACLCLDLLMPGWLRKGGVTHSMYTHKAKQGVLRSACRPCSAPSNITDARHSPACLLPT